MSRAVRKPGKVRMWFLRWQEDGECGKAGEIAAGSPSLKLMKQWRTRRPDLVQGPIVRGTFTPDAPSTRKEKRK